MDQDTLMKLLFARFSSHENGFIIIPDFRTNPECSSMHITLRFKEADTGGKIFDQGIEFTICLNLETGEEINPPSRSSHIQEMAHEFLSALTDDARREFIEIVRINRNVEKRAAEYTIDEKDLDEALLIPSSQIYHERGSIASGGESCRFVLSHGCRRYYIEDMYCAAPHCKCNEAHLMFLWELERPDGTITAEQLFMGKVNFKKKWTVESILRPKGAGAEGNETFSKREAEAVMAAFLANEPHVMTRLKETYAEIKKIGARSLKAAEMKRAVKALEIPQPLLDITAQKAGRNEPCPCGSGKKYKKCHGR
jgi:hypothetical protein